jgi:type IV pilus assembly protein PilM
VRQQVFVERSLAASPNTPNLLKPHLYRDALAQVSGGSAAARSVTPKQAAAAIVIPDYAVRMAILDFEEFPAGEEERSALIRFRLRKTVPFHIDEAQVAYSVQVNEPKRIEVLAIAIARPILSEYETLFTAAGYRVGLVTPSSIAVLPLCAGPEPGLRAVAKLAGSTLSVLLLEQERVRLVRCLDLSAGEGEEAEVEQGESHILTLLQQTLAYAEDQIGQPATRLLLCGFGPETDVFGRLAQDEFRIPYTGVRSRFGAASQQNAGLMGLLEQYAA